MSLVERTPDAEADAEADTDAGPDNDAADVESGANNALDEEEKVENDSGDRRTGRDVIKAGSIGERHEDGWWISES